MEIKEIVTVLIAVIVLALMAWVIFILFSGRGGETLASIKSMLRFGRA